VVSSFVNKHIDRSSTGSFLKSVLDILAPGMFFKAHPLLGLILSVSTEFGFSASAILERIVSVIKHKILSGNQIDPAEINSAAGVDIVQAMQYLHEIDKRGELLKTAQKNKAKYNDPVGGSFLYR